MADSDLTLINAMTEKLKWHAARQKTLAENIANADTPGYEGRDLKPVDFKRLLGNTTSSLSLSGTDLATTNEKHLSSGTASGGQAKSQTDKTPYEIAPDGNAVVLEEQLMKMNENVMDHQMIINMYQKQMDWLKTATDR